MSRLRFNYKLFRSYGNGIISSVLKAIAFRLGWRVYLSKGKFVMISRWKSGKSLINYDL